MDTDMRNNDTPAACATSHAQDVPPCAPLPPTQRSWGPVRLFRSIMRSAMYLLAVLGGIVLLAAFSRLSDVGRGGGFAGQQETVIDEGAPNADTIAIISLNGEIDGGGSHIQGNGMVLTLAQQLRHAAANPDIRAVILQIDSPGGGLTASDILHNEVLRLKKHGKKVIVSVGDLAASGGYYIAAPADYIIARPTSMVGSIGVIMAHFDVSELMKKIGIVVEPIKSAENKDILSPFRQMTPKERAETEKLTQHYHSRFVSIVAQGRSLPEEKVRTLANGMIYTAQESLAHGLIDEIGYFDMVLAKAQEIAGMQDKPRIVTYSPTPTLRDMLFGAKASVNPLNAKGLLKMVRKVETPRLELRWTGN